MANLALPGKQPGYRWLLIGIILLAALVRLPTLTRQSLWFDEAVTVAFSLADVPTLLRAVLIDGVHPPLFYFVSKVALSLWGLTEFGVRFQAVVPALLTIPVIYRLGQAMVNRPVGLLAALLLALNPLHVWLSQETRMYGLLLLLVTASMLFFWLGLHTNRPRYWLGLFGVNALAFNIHYFSLLLPAIQLAIILSRFRDYVRPFRWWVVVQFTASLTFLPWLIALSRREYQSFGIGSLQRPGLADIPLTLWNFAGGFSTYLSGPLAVAAAIILAIALGSGLWRRDRRFRFAQIMLAWWVFLPVGLVWLVSQRRSFYADKYLSLVIPGLLLLLALGAIQLKQSPRWRNLLVAGLIIASGYGLLSTWSDPAFFRDNWRDLVAYVSQHEQPGDVILLYTPHIELPFNYYYTGQNPHRPISRVLEYLPIEPLTAGQRRAWLIYPYSRHPTHDPKRPIRPAGGWQEDSGRNPLLVDWLARHADHQLDYRHFRGLELWLVELDQATITSNR